MEKKSKKKIVFILGILFVIAGCIVLCSGFFTEKKELKSIKSDSELYSFYDNSFEEPNETLIRIFTLPFSLLKSSRRIYDYGNYIDYGYTSGLDSFEGATASAGVSKKSSKTYSTTNIQVENVDEADIIKTDGDYLYSISDSEVIITNAKDPSNLKIESRISLVDDSVPEDLIIYDDKLVVIAAYSDSGILTRRYYSNDEVTSVSVYDISDKEEPVLKKNYQLNEPYYTSRRIDNKLYVIASGYLRLEEGETKKISREYSEDYSQKEFPLTDIKYLEDVKSDNITLVSVVDLDNPTETVKLSPFLIDISNAYVSEKSFYLLNKEYDYGDYEYDIKSIFGLKGLIGYILGLNESHEYSYGYETEIYKFDISPSGEISYAAKTKLDGSTINQYSLDEKDGHLRIALQSTNGSYVAVLNEKLNKLGESNRLAKGESMYSSRFMGDKAYLVTYKNTDPLFVIDLANEQSPKVLGQLKIPGYSTYLHPYDETHLIGIGIDTEERTQKDENGKVLWTSVVTTGMKMALFDVSDFENPKELAKTKIGDSYTRSAILSNPKALLFLKEKNLIAIPVNNYLEENESEILSSYVDRTDLLISTYEDDDEDYISEGYLVYDINLKDGFTKKGTITHEDASLIRGAFIENDLFVISEQKITVSSLDTLNLKSTLTLIND